MMHAEISPSIACAPTSTGQSGGLSRRSLMAAAVAVPAVIAVPAVAATGKVPDFSAWDRKYERDFYAAWDAWKAAKARLEAEPDEAKWKDVVDDEYSALAALVIVPVSSAILFRMKWGALPIDMYDLPMPDRSFTFGDVIKWDINRLVAKEWVA